RAMSPGLSGGVVGSVDGDHRPGRADGEYFPRARRARTLATDGDIGPMGSSSGSSGIKRPADEYARLWEPGGAIPDVFACLATRREIPVADRLEVLLVDQHLRWLRDNPLPLRVYLSAFPEIAEHGEMIRALVDGERQHRRRSTRRPNETVP